MDDVGWGDFGCYGGGVAVGAPTPNFDKLARDGLQLTSCYSEPSPARPRARRCMTGRVPEPPRPAPPADVRRAGRPAGRDHPAAAAVARPATSRRRSASGISARTSSRSRRTSASTTSTASCRCRTCTPSGATRTSSPRSSTRTRAPSGSRTCRSTSCFVHAKKGGELSENVEEVTIPVLSRARREVVPTTRSTSSSTQAKGDQPWLLYHCTRGAHFDNYPHEKFLGKSPARHPYKDTLVELDDIMGRLVEALRRDRASSRTR